MRSAICGEPDVAGEAAAAGGSLEAAPEAEDAARVCALVNATPMDDMEGCATVASFAYGRPLYDRLRAARDARTVGF